MPKHTMDPFAAATAIWDAARPGMRVEALQEKHRIESAQNKARTVMQPGHAIAAGEMARKQLVARAKTIRKSLTDAHQTVGNRKNAEWTADAFTSWANSRINEEAADLNGMWPWPEGRARYEQPIEEQRKLEQEHTRAEFARHFEMHGGILPHRWRKLASPSVVVDAIKALLGMPK